MSTKRPDRIAAIDIGTNSIHLVVARVIKETGGFEVLDHDKDMVRLGAGIGPNGELTDKAIDKALFAIRKFQARSKASGASLRIVEVVFLQHSVCCKASVLCTPRLVVSCTLQI